jgi:hypothetical protein
VSVKTGIEASTDALAAPAYATPTADELAELVGLLRPIAQAVVLRWAWTCAPSERDPSRLERILQWLPGVSIGAIYLTAA